MQLALRKDNAIFGSPLLALLELLVYKLVNVGSDKLEHRQRLAHLNISLYSRQTKFVQLINLYHCTADKYVTEMVISKALLRLMHNERYHAKAVLGAGVVELVLQRVSVNIINPRIEHILAWRKHNLMLLIVLRDLCLTPYLTQNITLDNAVVTCNRVCLDNITQSVILCRNGLCCTGNFSMLRHIGIESKGQLNLHRRYRLVGPNMDPAREQRQDERCANDYVLCKPSHRLLPFLTPKLYEKFTPTLSSAKTVLCTEPNSLGPLSVFTNLS